MKRTALFILFFICAVSSLLAGYHEQVILIPQGGHHSGLPMLADEPDVYHDTDAQEIIVDGDGTATYYDVEIASAGTLAVVISTQVGGSYGTIDVSALPAGHIYVITLRSSLGNTFEGYFET